MVTLNFLPPPTDANPPTSDEISSGLKEMRIYRADIGTDNFEFVEAIAVNSVIWQSTAYNDGRFGVVVVDNAGNMSEIMIIETGKPDLTPPLPVTNLEVSVSSNPQVTTTAKVVNIVVDATGASFSLAENNPAQSTLIEYVDDSHAGVWQTLTTLSAGVTTGRLNKTWVQGTHSFVCLRATQNGTTTEQDCRPLSSVFSGGTTPQLTNLTLTPTALDGGGQATGVVTLNVAAQAGGFTVQLSSNVPSVASVPASVTVTQGNTQASFSISTTNPSINTAVTITANASAVSLPASLTVRHVVISGETGGTWPNKPSAFTTLTSWEFNTITGSGWAQNGSAYVSSDGAAPVSPSSVMTLKYPIGFSGGGSPDIVNYNMGDKPELYLGYAWKCNSNWQAHPTNVNKLAFQMTPGGLSLIQTAWGTSSPYRIICALEFNTDNSHLGSGFGDVGGTWQLFGNRSSGDVSAGQWYKIEVYYKRSSSTSSRDGILKWWVGGTLVGEFYNVNFPSSSFYEMLFSPTWGGVGSNKTQDDYFYFDHCIIAVP